MQKYGLQTRRQKIASRCGSMETVRSKNNDLVAASGLPELVVSDADHWFDFLDHGILEHHDDPLCFSVDDLTVRQKAFLLQLVGTEAEGLYTVVGLSLIADLVQTLKRHYPE